MGNNKVMKSAMALLKTNKTVDKFRASLLTGHRIVPNRKEDGKGFPLRIDAGHYDPETKQLQVNLQVNTQASAPGLVEWKRKNSTHANLATATVDLGAEDKKEEVFRVLDELEEKGTDNLTK